jgi:hypothetical protein
VAGRQLWESFQDVIILDENNRIQESDEAGQALLRMVRLFTNWRVEAPDRSEVAEVCDAIQSKSVNPEQLRALLDQDPHAVVLRNAVRVKVDACLAELRARHTKKRLVRWQADDQVYTGRGKKKQALSMQANRQAQACLKAAQDLHDKKTSGLPSFGYFFEGCHYIFVDNLAKGAGRITNNRAIGQRLILDPREPSDDGSGDVWSLKYVPLGVIVQPEGVDVGDICHSLYPACPSGCIVVQPTTSKPLEVKGPTKGNHMCSAMFKRRTIPLVGGYCVTDYYAQGMSFRKEVWLADLRPPDNHFKRASVTVVLSRYESMDTFRALAPLWPEGDMAARERIIDKFCACAAMPKDLRNEMERLYDLDSATFARHKGLLAQHCPSKYGQFAEDALVADVLG